MARADLALALLRWTLAVAFVAGPAALGVTTALLADDSVPTLLLLLVEPLLWFALVATGVALLLYRQYALGLAALAGWFLFALSLRVPIQPVAQTGHGVELGATARACAAASSLPTGSFSVATWNTAGQSDLSTIAEAATTLDADILVLQEVPGAVFANGIAHRLGGDVVWQEATEGRGTAILLRRGQFLACDRRGLAAHVRGDGVARSWAYSLAAAPGRRAIATVAFAEIRPHEAVPIVAVHLDRPNALDELGNWPAILDRSAERMASLIDAIGHPGTVLAGDTNTHGTFRHFHSRVAATGVESAPMRPTWPARVFGLPTLPLYHLDRLWYGPGWNLDAVQTVRVGGDHLAVRVELARRVQRIEATRGE